MGPAASARLVARRYRPATATVETTWDIGGPGDGNLWSPADNEEDHGARGRFGHQAHGALDPSFLRSLPPTLRDVVASAVDLARTFIRSPA
jgi:hypothetical protein